MQNGREGADGSSPMIGLPIAKENAKFARPRHTPRGAQSSQSVHEYHSDILHLLLSRPRYRVVPVKQKGDNTPRSRDERRRRVFQHRSSKGSVTAREPVSHEKPERLVHARPCAHPAPEPDSKPGSLFAQDIQQPARAYEPPARAHESNGSGVAHEGGRITALEVDPAGSPFGEWRKGLLSPPQRTWAKDAHGDQTHDVLNTNTHRAAQSTMSHQSPATERPGHTWQAQPHQSASPTKKAEEGAASKPQRRDKREKMVEANRRPVTPPLEGWGLNSGEEYSVALERSLSSVDIPAVALEGGTGENRGEGGRGRRLGAGASQGERQGDRTLGMSSRLQATPRSIRTMGKSSALPPLERPRPTQPRSPPRSPRQGSRSRPRSPPKSPAVLHQQDFQFGDDFKKQSHALESSVKGLPFSREREKARTIARADESSWSEFSPSVKGESSLSGSNLPGLRVVPLSLLQVNLKDANRTPRNKASASKSHKQTTTLKTGKLESPPYVMLEKPNSRQGRIYRLPSARGPLHSQDTTSPLDKLTDLGGIWRTVEDKREFVIPLEVFGVSDKDYHLFEDEAGRSVLVK